VSAVVAHSEGVGYPAISPSVLAGLSVWLPPLPEQRSIAAFLDRETARIDALAGGVEIDQATKIGRLGRLIAHLHEYRAALVSAAVTGRIDVRQEATP